MRTKNPANIDISRVSTRIFFPEMFFFLLGNEECCRTAFVHLPLAVRVKRREKKRRYVTVL